MAITYTPYGPGQPDSNVLQALELVPRAYVVIVTGPGGRTVSTIRPSLKQVRRHFADYAAQAPAVYFVTRGSFYLVAGFRPKIA
jgi:hypothetical protein